MAAATSLTSRCPLTHAVQMAERRAALAVAGLAPASSSSLQASTWPPATAACSAVKPEATPRRLARSAPEPVPSSLASMGALLSSRANTAPSPSRSLHLASSSSWCVALCASRRWWKVLRAAWSCACNARQSSPPSSRPLLTSCVRRARAAVVQPKGVSAWAAVSGSWRKRGTWLGLWRGLELGLGLGWLEAARHRSDGVLDEATTTYY
eukprot:scaffold33967_cov41-Phaeocystis_antarctica.AAC.2